MLVLIYFAPDWSNEQVFVRILCIVLRVMETNYREIEISDESLERIFSTLNGFNKLDFRSYKLQTVKRRISRRINMVNCATDEEYLKFLEDNQTEVEALFNDLLIEVTNFFRDTEAFDSLQANVIPSLISLTKDELRVWVVACATGQEAYSIAILLYEALQHAGKKKAFRIFATDVSDEAIAFASAGIFTRESLEQSLSEDYIARYFYAIDDKRMRIHPRIRSKISFFKHNVLSDPPFPYIDLLTCRNLLIYFNPEFQKQVLSTFHFALNEQGYLFLGSSESLNEISYGFHTLDSRWRIFVKNNEVKLPFEAHRLRPEPVNLEKFAAKLSGLANSGSGSVNDIYDGLIGHFLAPGIVVDKKNEIVHINGEVMRYFPSVKGRLSSQVLDWAEGELKIALASALARCERSEKKVVISEVPVEGSGFSGTADVAVSPFKAGNDYYYFVQVGPAPETSSRPIEESSFNLQSDARERIENLEAEVRDLQQSLYAAIEERRSSQEELQASNEELRASNEELQSSNEELQAITSENEKKIRELASLNNDINNLLKSTDIAAIFLDEELCIRRFTREAEVLIGLSLRDIGRPVVNIRSDLIDFVSIEADSQRSLTNGYSVEREINMSGGRSFIYRLLPFRDETDQIRGVVLTYTETTSLREAQDAYVESEARYRAAVEAVDDAVWSYDVGNDSFDCSERWFTMFDCSSDCDHIGLRDMIQFVHPEDREKFATNFTRTVDSGESFDHELRIFHSGNPLKWIIIRGRSMEVDESGNISRIMGVCSDNTVRKELELNRHQQDTLLALLCDGIGLGFWTLDLTSDNLEFDSVSAKIAGVEEDASMNPARLAELVRAEDRSDMCDRLRDVREGHSNVILHECRIDKAEGETWVRISGVVCAKNADGLSSRVVGFIEDITQRKKVEVELKSYTYELIKQKSLLGNLIENMPLAVLAIDPGNSFRFSMCNPAAEKFFDLDSDRIVGETVADLFPAEDAWRYQEQDRLIMINPRVVDLGEQTMTLGDKIRDVRMVKIPVHGPGNKVDLIFVLLEDVTEARSLERQLNHSQKMDAVGRLAGGIAHDFNNMLQAIIGYGSLLAEELVASPENKESTDLILRAAHQASGLVKQLMAFSRREELVKRQVDAGALIKELVKMLDRLLGEHIAVKVKTCPERVWILADPGNVEQALINLCINARDAMPEGGELTISLQRQQVSENLKIGAHTLPPGNYGCIKVMDTGRGVPQKYIEHIFEPFFTTKELGKGTGLGLATVYAIVSRHDGYVMVDSSEGKGTVFSIYLPECLAPGASEPVFEKLSEPGGGTETILLAEDEPMVRNYAATILKRAGYNVIMAVDGRDAVDKFVEHKDDVQMLVFDVMMPRMNGRQAYESIEKIRPGVPVLFCSGYGDDLLKNEYMVDIDGKLLPKPYRSGDLLREIRELLSH